MIQTSSAGWEGAVRGLALFVVMAIAAWFSNAVNLQGWVNPAFILAITTIAGSIEAVIAKQTGVSAFGAIRKV